MHFIIPSLFPIFAFLYHWISVKDWDFEQIKFHTGYGSRNLQRQVKLISKFLTLGSLALCAYRNVAYRTNMDHG